jgi:hypothetical protein
MQSWSSEQELNLFWTLDETYWNSSRNKKWMSNRPAQIRYPEETDLCYGAKSSKWLVTVTSSPPPIMQRISHHPTQHHSSIAENQNWSWVGHRRTISSSKQLGANRSIELWDSPNDAIHWWHSFVALFVINMPKPTSDCCLFHCPTHPLLGVSRLIQLS